MYKGRGGNLLVPLLYLCSLKTTQQRNYDAKHLPAKKLTILFSNHQKKNGASDSNLISD